ncbi:MAG: phosphoribosylanthranilate isomerase [Candidatus Dormibacteraeota bacterium]|nr:phosphoribosylanthranilate isomerase [Candidatus Dormibacteraeota bacterium]
MRIKVCGNTAIDTAMAAVEAGADMLGFIMVPGTPRSLTTAQAAGIARAMPNHVELVGVFVDRPAAEVAEVAAEAGFTAVQLHGRETWLSTADLDLPVIKGARLASSSAAAALRWPPAQIVLVDSHDPGVPGGTGRTFPWEWAADLASRYRLIVSGGLGADNVADAVRQVGPWGVDASSRLESSPGVKDPERVRAYVAAARRAEAELLEAVG